MKPNTVLGCAFGTPAVFTFTLAKRVRKDIVCPKGEAIGHSVSVTLTGQQAEHALRAARAFRSSPHPTSGTEGYTFSFLLSIFA